MDKSVTARRYKNEREIREESREGATKKRKATGDEGLSSALWPSTTQTSLLKTISLPALSSSSSSPPTPTGRHHTPYPLIPTGGEGGRAGGKEVAMLHREAARREKMEMMGAFRLAATAYHRHSSAAGRIFLDIGSVRVCKRETRR